MRANHMVVPRCLTLPVLGIALIGCGDGGTAPPATSMLIEVEVCLLQDGGGKLCPAASVTPGALVEAGMAIDPQGGTLERVILEVTGLVAQTDTFVPLVPGPGRAVAFDTISIPFAVGSVAFSARAEGGGRQGESNSVTVTVGDTEPPVVDQVALVQADSVEPGDSVRLAVDASDNAVVMEIIVRSSGALEDTDTIQVQTPVFSDTLRYEVPETTPFGTPLSFEVLAVDAAGLESAGVSSEVVTVADYTPPVAGGSLHTGIQEPLVPGDTLRGTIEASDNHRLAWVGYRVGDPVVEQDSFPVSSPSTSFDFTAIAQSSWIGDQDVTLFARDSTGNVGIQDHPLTITVLDAIRRPFLSAEGAGAVNDLVFDAKRGRLYALHTGTISVLPLATFVHDPPLLMPDGFWTSGGLELSPSGDSLLVLISFFPDTATLGVANLTEALPALDTVHLNYDKALGLTHDLGVGSNGKAFVTLWDGTGGGGLLEYDLVNGQQQLRADAGTGGVIPTPANLLVSGDRTKTFLRWAPVPCCPDDLGQVYDVGSDAFGPTRELPFANSRDGSASSDVSGDRFLIGGHLLDGALDPVGFFDYPTSTPGSVIVSAVSPDGTFGYFAQVIPETDSWSVLKVRLADGAVVERILMPEGLGRLMVLPGGETLVAVGATNTIYALDLR